MENEKESTLAQPGETLDQTRYRLESQAHNAQRYLEVIDTNWAVQRAVAQHALRQAKARLAEFTGAADDD